LESAGKTPERFSSERKVYTHAGMEKRRMAQSRVVDVLFDRRPQDVVVQ
jgi:hypothetical protein